MCICALQNKTSEFICHVSRFLPSDGCFLREEHLREVIEGVLQAVLSTRHPPSGCGGGRVSYSAASASTRGHETSSSTADQQVLTDVAQILPRSR